MGNRALAGHSADLDSIGVDEMNLEELDRLDWTNDSEKSLPPASELVQPFGWKVLVMPIRAPSKVGSILIPLVRQDTDQYLNYVGRIAAIGPLAYKHSKYRDMGLKPADMPKRGDWVLYPIYQYQRIDFKGTKLIILNDDSFLAVVPKGVSPWDFKLER